MTQGQIACINFVRSLDSSLAPNLADGGVRPNAGFHTAGLAQDFLGDLPEIFRTFEKAISSGWRGGIGIGIRTADRHLHIDCGHLAGSKVRPAYWIEIDKTVGHEVCLQTRPDDFKKLLEEARHAYGA